MELIFTNTGISLKGAKQPGHTLILIKKSMEVLKIFKGILVTLEIL